MASSGARGLVVVGLLVGLVAACSEDKPGDDGKAGSAGTGATTQVGGGGSASGSGGSKATAGSAGKTGGSSGSAGSSSGSGGSAGSGGNAASGTELSASTTACEPDCPESQYCALLEVDCTSEPCLVSAVCKDRNKCSSSSMCPHAPMELCADDPDTDCAPGDPGCMGICRCSENAMPCAPQALDRRASVCACVDKLGDEEFCSDVDCPDNAKCVIELGKSYCVMP